MPSVNCLLPNFHTPLSNERHHLNSLPEVDITRQGVYDSRVSI